MKKLLGFFVSFFIILPLTSNTTSCSLDKKNDTDNLIAWFNNNYPTRKVDSISLGIHIENLYMINGYYIDKVIYSYYSDEPLKLKNSRFLAESNYDYVIYNSRNHQFYDINNLDDNLYSFVAWAYLQGKDISSGILSYDNTNKIDSVLISFNDTPRTVFHIEIIYYNHYNKEYDAIWEYPTFKLISDHTDTIKN